MHSAGIYSITITTLAESGVKKTNSHALSTAVQPQR